jgi:cupin 2 domain-containing protein
MPTKKKQNLFTAIPLALPDEFCEVLCRSDRVRVERIISQGHRSAEGFWYDQPTDEFVLLVSGRATLEFADAPEPVTLQAGDWLVIKAHIRHRVSWTEPGQQTVWLAVHY